MKKILLSISLFLSFFSVQVHAVEVDFEEQPVSYNIQSSLDGTKEDQVNISIGEMGSLWYLTFSRELSQASFKESVQKIMKNPDFASFFSIDFDKDLTAYDLNMIVALLVFAYSHKSIKQRLDMLRARKIIDEKLLEILETIASFRVAFIEGDLKTLQVAVNKHPYLIKLPTCFFNNQIYKKYPDCPLTLRSSVYYLQHPDFNPCVLLYTGGAEPRPLWSHMSFNISVNKWLEGEEEPNPTYRAKYRFNFLSDLYSFTQISNHPKLELNPIRDEEDKEKLYLNVTFALIFNLMELQNYKISHNMYVNQILHRLTKKIFCNLLHKDENMHFIVKALLYNKQEQEVPYKGEDKADRRRQTNKITSSAETLKNKIETVGLISTHLVKNFEREVNKQLADAISNMIGDMLFGLPAKKGRIEAFYQFLNNSEIITYRKERNSIPVWTLKNIALYESVYRDKQCLNCLKSISMFTQEPVACKKCDQLYCSEACYLQDQEDLIHPGIECFICEQKNILAPRMVRDKAYPSAIILRYAAKHRTDPYPYVSSITLQNVPISYFIVLASLWRQATMN